MNTNLRAIIISLLQFNLIWGYSILIQLEKTFDKLFKESSNVYVINCGTRYNLGNV